MQDLLTSDLRYSSSQFKEMGIKEKITKLLLSTGRENIGNVLEHMASNGFFTGTGFCFENIPLCRLIQEADRNAANQSVKKKNATTSEVTVRG